MKKSINNATMKTIMIALGLLCPMSSKVNAMNLPVAKEKPYETAFVARCCENVRRDFNIEETFDALIEKNGITSESIAPFIATLRQCYYRNEERTNNFIKKLIAKNLITPKNIEPFVALLSNIFENDPRSYASYRNIESFISILLKKKEIAISEGMSQLFKTLCGNLKKIYYNDSIIRIYWERLFLLLMKGDVITTTNVVHLAEPLLLLAEEKYDGYIKLAINITLACIYNKLITTNNVAHFIPVIRALYDVRRYKFGFVPEINIIISQLKDLVPCLDEPVQQSSIYAQLDVYADGVFENDAQSHEQTWFDKDGLHGDDGNTAPPETAAIAKPSMPELPDEPLPAPYTPEDIELDLRPDAPHNPIPESHEPDGEDDSLKVAMKDDALDKDEVHGDDGDVASPEAASIAKPSMSELSDEPLSAPYTPEDIEINYEFRRQQVYHVISVYSTSRNDAHYTIPPAQRIFGPWEAAQWQKLPVPELPDEPLPAPYTAEDIEIDRTPYVPLLPIPESHEPDGEDGVYDMVRPIERELEEEPSVDGEDDSLKVATKDGKPVSLYCSPYRKLYQTFDRSQFVSSSSFSSSFLASNDVSTQTDDSDNLKLVALRAIFKGYETKDIEELTEMTKYEVGELTALKKIITKALNLGKSHDEIAQLTDIPESDIAKLVKYIKPI